MAINFATQLNATTEKLQNDKSKIGEVKQKGETSRNNEKINQLINQSRNQIQCLY